MAKQMRNFNKPLILEGKSKIANDSKTPFSNYKSGAHSTHDEVMLLARRFEAVAGK
jgi:hypothetical protein